MIVGFTKFIVAQVLMSDNLMVDALTNLASSALYPGHVELNIMAHSSIHNVAVLTTENQVDCSWIPPILSYLRSRILPKDRREVVKVKARVARYALLNDVMYRRLFFGPYQRCVLLNEAKRIIEQIHGGICNTHISGRTLYRRIMTKGFYWPIMKQESELFVKNCDTC